MLLTGVSADLVGVLEHVLAAGGQGAAALLLAECEAAAEGEGGEDAEAESAGDHVAAAQYRGLDWARVLKPCLHDGQGQVTIFN